MGEHCKMKYIDEEDKIDYWYGILAYVHMVTPQNWFENVCPWEKESK